MVFGFHYQPSSMLAGEIWSTPNFSQSARGRYQCLAPVSRVGLWDLDFRFLVDGELARVKRTMEVR